MAQEDYRFSISAEKYLERHEVLDYMEDAVQQLLEHKEENPKVNPTKFFSDYFSSVKEGNHVLFREYAYVSATSHNRSSFVRMFWKCFRHIGRKGDLLNIKEYHSLMCLLCPDFPFQPVQKTARIVLMDDAMDCLISFGDFLYAFQAQFCYEEFLSRCAEVYKTITEEPHTPRETVVVPTSDPSPKPQVHRSPDEEGAAAVPEASSDGVDSTVFYRALVPVAEKMDIKAPPVHLLKQILSTAKRVTFYGFLMAMAKNEELNKYIGKIPDKIHLLEIPDQELTSPLLRPNTAVRQHQTQANPKNKATDYTVQIVPSNITTATSGGHSNITATTSGGHSNTKSSDVKVTEKLGQGQTGPSDRSAIRRSIAAAKAKRQEAALADSSSDESDDSSSTN